jgi:hypothetical protein
VSRGRTLPEHTPAEKRRALAGCLCYLGALGCAFAGVDTWGPASYITGSVALLLCGAGYLLIR